MVHYFLSCYFNYCDYESREKLTREFINRYPNVILIEVAFEDQNFKFSDCVHYRKEQFDGWATNWALNKFIKDNWNDLESVTFIDSDTILEKDFFDDIKHVFNSTDRPLYLQPYSCAQEHINGTFIERSGVMYAYKTYREYSCYFHTGLAYSYNRKFLEIVGSFPEKLSLGSFDQFLYYCLFKLDKHITYLYKQIDNNEVITELVNYRRKFNEIKPENFNYLFGNVYTFQHGNKENRGYNTRAYLYRGMTDSNSKLKIIKEYFKSRKEDQN